jgi:hypothetical protein
MPIKPYTLMRVKNVWIIAVTGILITTVQSCSKPCGCPAGPTLKSGDVLVAGNATYPGSSEVAAYWVNGALNRITNIPMSWATGIAASGQDVYVIGDTANQALDMGSVYWKNGIKMTLSGEHPFARSIFVSGTDVYITGFNRSASGSITAVYWKNGDIHTLNTLTPGQYAMAKSGFVSGTDVYFAGETTITPGNFVCAVYWKNGVPVKLGNPASISSATTIFVSGTDVYIGGSSSGPAGFGNDVATLWKNGIPTYLETKSSLITGLVVSGNDLLAVGSVSPYTAAYWKNGVSVTLPGFSSFTGSAYATSVAFHGSDVYICGRSGFDATFWKNGVETKITEGKEISSIFIVP